MLLSCFRKETWHQKSCGTVPLSVSLLWIPPWRSRVGAPCSLHQTACHTALASFLPVDTLPQHTDFYIYQRVLNDLLYRMIWLLFHPLSPSTVNRRDRRHTGKTEKEWQVADGRGGGAESYDRKKAWSSINHSILSGLYNTMRKHCINHKRATLTPASLIPATY